MNTALDYLDSLAREWRHSGVEPDAMAVLSTSEELYVRLAASKLSQTQTIPAALARLGDDWLQELIARHRYA
ncbi:MAG: hypothetical protein NTX56_05255 [Proteobacteria bacterium]|nr:hypothetical protein [Pseudomonadota bacterium]